MSYSDIIKAVDHASSASDRWLFIFALLLLVMFASLVGRYFVKQHERLIDDHKEARKAHAEILQKVVDQQDTTTREVTQALTQSTLAINACTEEMRLLRISRPI